MPEQTCEDCKFIDHYYKQGCNNTEYLRICSAEPPEPEAGFLMYTDVGDGDHADDCSLFSPKNKS